MATNGESDKFAAADRLATWIAATAPKETAVAADWIGPSASFDAAEEEAVAGAVVHRRDEFRTGRRLARKALAQLGCAAQGLPPDRDRVPQWPEGFVGTISHSEGLCVALVGRARNLVGIGIDIEGTVEIQPELVPRICRPDEIALDEYRGVVDLTLLRFVAKEAFFKVYFPATRAFLDFHDVWVAADPASDRFEVRLMNPSCPSLCGSRAFTGRLATVGNHVVAGVWVAR